jgi:lipoate-protein ligase A
MSYPKTTWRLIQTPPAHGAWNMAADEAILEASTKGAVPPTLRLYAWDPPCLSLGYAQPVADLDIERLTRLGWHLVRRPTGGRAILHTDELTYSISGHQDEPRLAGGVLDSYRRLSLALLDALLHLGVDAAADPQPSQPLNATPKGPVCFEVPSNYEITVRGKKLIGSAQARRHAGVLQHGTLPLFGDLTRITQVLCYPTETDRQYAADRVRLRAATLETIAGHTITWEQASRAFVDAFESTLDVQLIPGDLTASEISRAAQLVTEKYANDDWTLKS